LSPREKCQSKNGIVDCYFHHRVNFPCSIAGKMAERG
jgi:hypothetical protein